MTHNEKEKRKPLVGLRLECGLEHFFGYPEARAAAFDLLVSQVPTLPLSAYVLVIFAGTTAQRCHDLNISAWTSFLMLVPYVNLVFALVPLLAHGRKPNACGPLPEPLNGSYQTELTISVGLFAAKAVALFIVFTKAQF